MASQAYRADDAGNRREGLCGRVLAHRSAQNCQVGRSSLGVEAGTRTERDFGTGTITGIPERGQAGNGKIQWMAPVRFTSFVDPKQELLIDEKTVTSILRPTQIDAQASGYPLDETQSNALDAALASTPIAVLGGSGDWTPAEIAAIVTDYFAMLDNEIAGRPYSKTVHRHASRLIVKRSPGSVERKHQNISSVLRNLGFPWVNGYKPLPNSQEALIEAVERHLEENIVAVDTTPSASAGATIDLASVFVPPPKPKKKTKTSQAAARIARKFDPALRDEANRTLGAAGEKFVLDVERKRLSAAGKNDLAKKVAWVSEDQGDGLGYDIVSYEDDGAEIYIEVKTTKGSIDTSFFVSENERRAATAKAAAFRLYRVFDYGKKPQIYRLTGPLEAELKLEPASYRAYVLSVD
jgi:Domain of unknown function (DUF3883)